MSSIAIRTFRGLWNIWTKCNGFEGRPAGGCLAIGRHIRLEFLPVAGHFHPTSHPPLSPAIHEHITSTEGTTSPTPHHHSTINSDTYEHPKTATCHSNST